MEVAKSWNLAREGLNACRDVKMPILSDKDFKCDDWGGSRTFSIVSLNLLLRRMMTHTVALSDLQIMFPNASKVLAATPVKITTSKSMLFYDYH